MDGAAILGRFLAADRFATIQGHGHEVGGPIGKAQTDAGCLRLHHGTGPVAHRMKNVLAGDAQAGSVIVGAEVGGDAFSARRLNQGRKHEQGLRGFDHDLHVCDAVIVQKVGKRGDLFDHGDLGKHDREIGRNPAKALAEPGESSQATLGGWLVEGLNADASEGRERAALKRRGHLIRAAVGGGVFFGIASDAVAVFEIDVKILHRFAAQLVNDAIVNGVGQGIGHAGCERERGGIGRVIGEGAFGQASHGGADVAFKEVRSTDHHVDRLARAGFAGMGARKLTIGGSQRVGKSHLCIIAVRWRKKGQTALSTN